MTLYCLHYAFPVPGIPLQLEKIEHVHIGNEPEAVGLFTINDTTRLILVRAHHGLVWPSLSGRSSGRTALPTANSVCVHDYCTHYPVT